MKFILAFLSLFCVNAFADFSETLYENKNLAEQGDAQVQCDIGDSYYNGVGVEKNEVEAVKWYRKSAEQGNAKAQLRLAFRYLSGEGVPKNVSEAYAYFNLASVKMHEAKILVIHLESKMTPTQIEDGQKRSLELQNDIDTKIAANKMPIIFEELQLAFNTIKEYINKYWTECVILALVAFIFIVDTFNPANLKMKPRESTEEVVIITASQSDKNEVSYFSCWWKTALILFLLLGLLGYLNSGAQGMAVMFGRGLIMAPFHALWIGWIWWRVKK